MILYEHYFIVGNDLELVTGLSGNKLSHSSGYTEYVPTSCCTGTKNTESLKYNVYIYGMKQKSLSSLINLKSFAWQ